MHGSAAFFGKQLAAGVGCSAYAFAFTANPDGVINEGSTPVARAFATPPVLALAISPSAMLK